MNLYQYVGNNPATYTDPFGLTPCDPPDDPDCPRVNFAKLAVGTINMVRGAAGTASGALALTAGKATAPVLGPVSGPAVVVGGGKVAFGLSNIGRGARQVRESLSDANGPTLRNALGLAPFGQEFDDPGEPGPVEYVKNRIQTFSLKQTINEFFAVEIFDLDEVDE